MKSKLKKSILLFCVLVPLQFVSARDAWPEKIQPEITKIAKNFKGQLGVYIKEVDSDLNYSFNSDNWWYYASAIKLFVAIEVYRQIDSGRLTMEQMVSVQKTDYRDGAGQTNWLAPDSKVNVRYLLEQMMLESDNAATDLLIGLVGVENLNRTTQTLAPLSTIGKVTSLLEVRKQAYGRLHPKAHELNNMDYIALKNEKSLSAKLKKFLNITRLTKKDLLTLSVESAFENYYREDINGGTLRAYGAILEQLAAGRVINAAKSREILELMSKCRTGKSRIAAGLPPKVVWAHKTGTQLNRMCDMGVLMTTLPSGSPRDLTGKKVVVAVCTKGFRDNRSSEAAFKKVAKALVQAGLFEKPDSAIKSAKNAKSSN